MKINPLNSMEFKKYSKVFQKLLDFSSLSLNKRRTKYPPCHQCKKWKTFFYHCFSEKETETLNKEKAHKKEENLKRP